MYSFLTNRYIVPKEGYPSLGLCLNTCIELTKNGESRLALPSSSWAVYTCVRLPASLWGAACPRCAAHGPRGVAYTGVRLPRHCGVAYVGVQCPRHRGVAYVGVRCPRRCGVAYAGVQCPHRHGVAYV